MIEAKITINYVCRDDKEKIHHSTGKLIGDSLALITEAVVVREVIKTAFQFKLHNLIIESDLNIVVNYTLGKIKASSQFRIWFMMLLLWLNI